MPRGFCFYPTGKAADFKVMNFKMANCKMFESLKRAAAIFFLIIWGALSNVATAQSETRDYLPLGRAELGRPFRLKRVAGSISGQEFAQRLNIGTASAELKFDDERGYLVLTGKDRAGNPWRVAAAGGSPGGVEIYEADLDRNGLRDLMLHAPTGGNGLAPSSHLVAVTFERDTGRPVRFEAEGYFEAGATGIFELRDMNGDGRAELIYMNFDDGYWITNLYTAADARWRRIKGRFGTRSFPLYTRFTNRPNRRATKPRAGRRPFAPDLSNNVAHLRGRLLSYRWANVSHSEDVELIFEETAARRQVTCRPDSWYSSFTVVKDGARGREIFSFAGSEEDVKSALDEIIAGGSEVSLSGQRGGEGCRPEVLWAKMK